MRDRYSARQTHGYFDEQKDEQRGRKIVISNRWSLASEAQEVMKSLYLLLPLVAAGLCGFRRLTVVLSIV